MTRSQRIKEQAEKLGLKVHTWSPGGRKRFLFHSQRVSHAASSIAEAEQFIAGVSLGYDLATMESQEVSE